jgi:flagellar protein FlgJ
MTNFNADISTLNVASQKDNAASNQETQMRRAAAEFESLLLAQMTSALNPKDEDENLLFGGGEGMNLSRQMYSEQLAKTMAEAGGIGLADVMLQKFHAQQGLHETKTINRAQHLSQTVRSINESAAVDKIQTPHVVNAVHKHHAKLKANVPAAVENKTAGNVTDAEPVLVSEAAPEEIAAAEAIRKANASDANATRRSVRNNARVDVEHTSVTSRLVVNPDAPVLPVAHVENATHAQNVALHMPVRGVLRSNFGVRRDPINGKHKFHTGVDLAAPRGTPIQAAADGKVVFAGRQRGYGNTVIIEHADGRRTRYAHAETLLVERGETVKSGQTIAKVGSTGRSTGPHLHFEVIEKGRHLNPLKFLANVSQLARR